MRSDPPKVHYNVHRIGRFVVIVPVANGKVLDIPDGYSEIGQAAYQRMISEHNSLLEGANVNG